MLICGNPAVSVLKSNTHLGAGREAALVVAGPLELDEAGDDGHEVGVWGDGVLRPGLPAVCTVNAGSGMEAGGLGGAAPPTMLCLCCCNAALQQAW